MSARAANGPERGAGDTPSTPELAVARRHLAERRLRDEVMGAEMFGEPAWDLLLTLFVAQGEGRRLCVTRLCDAIPVPNTTVLRWIFSLTQRGLLIREGDPRNRRRVYLSLSDEAGGAVCALLARFVALPG